MKRIIFIASLLVSVASFGQTKLLRAESVVADKNIKLRTVTIDTIRTDTLNLGAKSIMTAQATKKLIDGRMGAFGAGAPGVTSISASAPPAGLTISGSPITTSGTFDFNLANDLAALEGLSGTGIAKRTGSDTWTVGATVGVTEGGTGMAGLGSALQLLRVNSLGTAYEFFTAPYLTANQTITLTGDITGSGSTSIFTTIAAGSVTNAKMENMASGRFKGRSTSGSGSPEDLTAAQATALLNVFTTSLKGLTPASAGGTINFLRADGTWAAPPGATTEQIARWDSVMVFTTPVTGKKIIRQVADDTILFRSFKDSTQIGFSETDTALTAYLRQLPGEWILAASDETTAITTGTAKLTFRTPYAVTVTGVKASLTTVSSSGTPTIDINENGTTILSTKLTIDASEKTSVTAASAAVISDASLANDAEITIDFDVAGTGATGVKIVIYWTRNL